MGTPAVVATMIDGLVKGRYVHWDGYPTGLGKNLALMVNRDGLEQVVKTTLLDHYGWSTLDGAAEPVLEGGYTDGRFATVPGYGVAYTTKDEHTNPDGWSGHGLPGMSGYFGYVLTESGVVVCQVREENHGGAWIANWVPAAIVPYDAAREAWKAVEDLLNEDEFEPLAMPAFPVPALSA